MSSCHAPRGAIKGSSVLTVQERSEAQTCIHLQGKRFEEKGDRVDAIWVYAQDLRERRKGRTGYLSR